MQWKNLIYPNIVEHLPLNAPNTRLHYRRYKAICHFAWASWGNLREPAKVREMPVINAKIKKKTKNTAKRCAFHKSTVNIEVKSISLPNPTDGVKINVALKQRTQICLSFNEL